MNRVEFTIAHSDGPCLIMVDGVALEEHARRAELRSARADGQEHLAGAYGGLTHLDAVRWPSRHFLGAPALPGAGDRDTVLKTMRPHMVSIAIGFVLNRIHNMFLKVREGARIRTFDSWRCRCRCRF